MSYVTLLPAANQIAIGAGCGGASNTPNLTLTPPVLGQATAVTLTDGEPSATGTLFIGVLAASPLVLAPGCEVYLDLLTIEPLLPIATDSQGTWSTTIPLPATALFAGLSASVQAALIPTSSSTGFDLTNAVAVVLGY